MTEIPKPKNKKTSKHVNFELYIKRVLKSLKDCELKNSAVEQLNEIIIYIAKAINSQVSVLMSNSGSKTLSARDVQSAVRVLLQGDLQTFAVRKATEAVTNFNSPRSEEKGAKISQSKRAHLIFSVSTTRKLLTCARIGAGAPVYLAGVLEYLAKEFLEAASTFSIADKKVRITPRHIFLGISNDPELKMLCDSLHIEIAASGVVPSVKGDEKKKKYRIDKETNKRVALAGTRADQDIARLQKLHGKVLCARAPFVRLIRRTAERNVKEFGLSSHASLALQMAVESQVIKILQNALEITKIAKKSKVSVDDFDATVRIMGLFLLADVHIEEKKHFVVNAAIKRLAHKAGVRLLHRNIYDGIRKFIYAYTNTIITKSLVSMIHLRRKRLALVDVLFGLETLGIKFAYSKKLDASKSQH